MSRWYVISGVGHRLMRWLLSWFREPPLWSMSYLRFAMQRGRQWRMQHRYGPGIISRRGSYTCSSISSRSTAHHAHLVMVGSPLTAGGFCSYLDYFCSMQTKHSENRYDWIPCYLTVQYVFSYRLIGLFSFLRKSITASAAGGSMHYLKHRMSTMVDIQYQYEPYLLSISLLSA